MTSDMVASAEDVISRLDQLQDLFKRRLLDDRERQRTFDALYEELRASRSLATGEATMPLIRSLFPVVDRLDTAGTEFALSIAEEILASLEINGVVEVAPDSNDFDARTQEVIGSVPVDDPSLHGKVVAVRRRGFQRNEQVVRPALVTIGAYAPGAEADG